MMDQKSKVAKDIVLTLQDIIDHTEEINQIVATLASKEIN